MMNTPICDFVEEYKNKKALRLHMPAHKGMNILGIEEIDITEISGADSLYEASGIIAESERNASRLFGSDTFYSTEGSSLCIRAIVYLLKLYGVEKIIASRNAHKSFLSAVALADIEVDWIYPKKGEAYISGRTDSEEWLSALEANAGVKTACYITSPDYLGNIADIASVSKLCRKYNSLLCVDNAHGAYLKFLNESLHPIDLGADICCDSAHKTLPTLTGGAYLHFSRELDSFFKNHARDALSLFGTTSPSYLILQSLDKTNAFIEERFKESLAEYMTDVEEAKKALINKGYSLIGDEVLKITVKAKEYGYYGYELGRILEKENIFPEFYDNDFLVLMLSPFNGSDALNRTADVLCAVEKKPSIDILPPRPERAIAAMTPRQAVFAKNERVSVNNAVGRILAQFNVACPPAVPIVVCGEIITEKALEMFEYYGIDEVSVVKLM